MSPCHCPRSISATFGVSATVLFIVVSTPGSLQAQHGDSLTAYRAELAQAFVVPRGESVQLVAKR